MDKTKSKRTRFSKMNVSQAKNKSLIENLSNRSDSLTSLGFASGDCFVPPPRCRICSGASHLRNLYVDHCDEVLSRLFDVEVPSTGKICEACVKCLRVCERFKLLVNSSFMRKSFARNHCDKLIETDRESDLQPVNPQREIIDLLTASLNNKKKPSVRRAYIHPTSSPPIKRTNISCTICQQKYLMITPDEGINDFICSRCKHNELRGNITAKRRPSSLPANELRSKNNLMGIHRLNTVTKSTCAPTLRKLVKHQCHLCPKSYVDPQHLAKHMKAIHEPVYVCNVCDKKIKNKDLYERHLKTHSSSRSVCYSVKRYSRKIC